MVSLRFSTLVIGLTFVFGSLPAEAGLLQIGKLRLACWKHNRKVDRDERLTVREFASFQKTRKLPAWVTPTAVLQRKMARAEVAFLGMRNDVGSVLGALAHHNAFDATVRSEAALAELNLGTSRLLEATRYARERGLVLPTAVHSLARQALHGLGTMDSAMARERLTYDHLYWGRVHPDPYAVAAREGNRQALSRLAAGLQ